LFRWRSLATRTRFSRPVRTSSTAANCPVRLRGDVEAVHARGAGVCLEQRGQDLDDSGLAGPVGAQQREDAAARHLEVHALQDVQLLVGLLDALYSDR
jgi:hypothetical protein